MLNVGDVVLWAGINGFYGSKKTRANYLLGEEVGLTPTIFIHHIAAPRINIMKLLPVNIHVKPSSTS